MWKKIICLMLTALCFGGCAARQEMMGQPDVEKTSDPPASIQPAAPDAAIETPQPPDPEFLPQAVGKVTIDDTAEMRIRWYYTYDGEGEDAVLSPKDREEIIRLLNNRELVNEWPACDPEPTEVFTICTGDEEYILHV